MGQFKYLKGLNALRFFAAFFVIISHGHITLIKLGICENKTPAFLNKGEDAVNFFFTLSGFLITYLLLLEINNSSTISVRQFYLRRVYRIWPVYFLVVFLGFFIFTILYKVLYGSSYFTFPVVPGLLAFIFFLPNYMALNFQVGLLYPLWSIGVEEQFYLFWAPLLKVFRKNVFLFIIIFSGLTTLLYTLFTFKIFVLPETLQKFMLTLKFFEMAIGSLFAYLLFKKFEWYNKSIFASKLFQLSVIGIILWHYFVEFPFSHSLFFKICCCFLYGCLILNASVITRKLINLDKVWLEYLGKISYGLYMYHMLVDYGLRTIVAKINHIISPVIIVPLYHIFLIGITILIAGLSYRYFEAYFLKMKTRLHNV